MEIKIDMQIGEKIIAKVNEFYDNTNAKPTKVTLSSTQYRDLWVMTYYTWTRKISEPHILKTYADCEIVIGLTSEIVCS